MTIDMNFHFYSHFFRKTKEENPLLAQRSSDFASQNKEDLK